MAKETNPHLPEPGAEPKGSADDVIAQFAGDELEKLMRSAAAAEEGGGGAEDAEADLMPVDPPAEGEAADGVEAPEPSAAEAGRDLEGEVVESVLVDAGRIKESELDELFAELTKDESGGLPREKETSTPAGPSGSAAPSVEQGVGPILGAASTGTPKAKEPAYKGPPFLTAATEWKPTAANIDVLKALPDLEHTEGLSWFIRVLIWLNRPFAFLSPEARQNLGYVGCVVMVSAIVLSGWAISKR
jgi:hypothetical protein